MNAGSRSGPPQGATATLKLLFDITREFSSTLELPAVLGKVLSLTVQSLGASQGSLFMLDERGEVVRYFLARQHLPAEERKRVVSVVMEKGLAGWVFRHRKGAIVEDTRTDDRWHVFDNDEKPVRSVLAAPLTRRGMMTGLVTLEHQQPGAFNRLDLQLLTAIAHQAAIAIENAHLFTQVSDERDTVASILNTVNDAILVSDGREHRLAMLNPAAATLLDLRPDDAVGKPLGDLLPDSPLLKLLDQAAEEQTQDAVIELAGGGHHHVRVHDIPRVGRVTVLHDITHFAELDALKSEFVAAVSHDLKNPLGTILGYAWMLDDEAGLTELQRRYVTSILQSVQRMQKLVGNLLDLAKIEAGVDADCEPCSVQTIIANVVNQFAARAGEGEIKLEVAVPDELPAIVANELRITQAIGNLVSNAIKYTPEGGRVVIPAKHTAESIIVGVIDSGPGISSVDQSRLFQKFSRVGGQEMAEIAGTGLGLAIVRSVVESHKGRVWVESQLGKGSAFFIQLPLDAALANGTSESGPS